jgi:hypothetical protein
MTNKKSVVCLFSFPIHVTLNLFRVTQEAKVFEDRIYLH